MDSTYPPLRRPAPFRPPRETSAFSPSERLAFNDRRDRKVPHLTLADQPDSLREPTFPTAVKAEPREWGYFGLLAFTAVLLLRPQEQVPALASLHLAEVFALVGIGPMLVHRLAKRLPAFRVNPETVGVLLFGVIMLATIPTSIWPSGTFREFTDGYLKIMIVFLLIMNTLTTPIRLDRLTWLIVMCVGFIAAKSVANYAQGSDLVEGGRLAGPVGGIFGNPNDLALNMVTFLPMAAVVALSRHRPLWRRAAAAAIAALMMATIVFTKSRAGGLGLVLALAALVFMGRRIRPGFGAMVVISVLVAAPMLPSSFWDRMASIVDEKQDQRQFTGSRAARETVMLEGIDTFLERPLTGVGAGQFKNYNPPGRKERWREAHNALIQVAAETGIVGLLTFLFLMVKAGTAPIATRRLLARPGASSHQRPSPSEYATEQRILYEHSIAMTAGFIGWVTCAMFASVASNWTFYYLLALAVAGRELAPQRPLPAVVKAISDRRKVFI